METLAVRQNTKSWLVKAFTRRLEEVYRLLNVNNITAFNVLDQDGSGAELEFFNREDALKFTRVARYASSFLDHYPSLTTFQKIPTTGVITLQ